MGQEEHPDDYQILIDRFIKSLNISKEDGYYWLVMVASVLVIHHMATYNLN